jgi:DNA modification methylase
MIKDEQLPELTAFRHFEDRLPMWYTPKYGDLVVASGNDSRAIHRWFRFKEGYSADFLENILSALGFDKSSSLQILDPFCGSGTTLLSADDLRRKGWLLSGVGIEVNPFIHSVADAKLSWSSINPERMLITGQQALKAAHRPSVALPELTSISEGRCINQHVARQLIAVRSALIDTRYAGDRKGLLLGLASAIEPLSKTRKDGRALRIVSDRAQADFSSTVTAKWEQIATDVAATKRPGRGRERHFRVYHGDGRNPSSAGLAPESVDVIVTSPPYPNNIDYTEVYKLELWLMGCVSTSEAFFNQRQMTVRSHPTCSPTPSDSPIHHLLQTGQLHSLLAPALTRLAKAKDFQRLKVLVGYCSDMYEALRNHYALLKPGGVEVLVVGNSLHGSEGTALVIPSDLVLAALGRHVGFTVEQLNIARSLKRRLSGNHFLRESVVVLRKPSC